MRTCNPMDFQRGTDSEPKTQWNRAETAKIRYTNTGKVSRRQGNAFLLCSCSLFSTRNVR